MAINYDRLNTKLDAILSMDEEAIILEGTYIPFLFPDYNKNQLRQWLKKVSDVLVDVRDGAYSDAQIQVFVDNLYASLSANDRNIADVILSGGEANLGSASDAIAYDKLRAISIYKFITS